MKDPLDTDDVRLYAHRMNNVVAMPDRESPRGRVAAEVRAEMARARVSGNRLAKLTSKSQAYWSRRITGDVAFDVDDLATLAAVLEVPIVRFFEADGLNRLGPRPDGPGGGARWAPWGSNPQPTD